MKKFLWIVTILFLLYGLSPVKFPRKAPIKLTDNTIIVHHNEWTCSADFDIINGKLFVPREIEHIPLISKTEIIVTGNSPLNYCVEQYATFDFLVSTDFVLRGRVVGVDSTTNGGCGNRLLFEVISWDMLEYYPKFLTFSKTAFFFFVLITPLVAIWLFVNSVIFFLRKKRGK